MKIKDLIQELNKLDQDAIVILSSDGEGNGYSPLSGLDSVLYRPQNTWSGEVVEADEREEHDVNAVALWPIN